MLKKDLVDQVAKQLAGCRRLVIAEALEVILKDIEQALVDERRVEIRGFGSFAVRTRAPRATKNPKTGLVMDIPARKTLHFTMSTSLKEVLIDKTE